jgi:hypothetical protein
LVVFAVCFTAGFPFAVSACVSLASAADFNAEVIDVATLEATFLLCAIDSLTLS